MTKDEVSGLGVEEESLRHELRSEIVSKIRATEERSQNLIIHLITVSAAIIAFVATFSDSNQPILSRALLIASQLELLVVIFYGFWHLIYANNRQNRMLGQIYEDINRLFDMSAEARGKYLESKAITALKVWEEARNQLFNYVSENASVKRGASPALRILFLGFAVALTLIIFAQSVSYGILLS